MKKIIAIASMAALVAGAAFAADVNASVEWSEIVADYDGTNFNALKLNKNTNDSLLTFDFAGEKAGAGFTLDMNSNGDGLSVNPSDMYIWFKLDPVKFTVGDVGLNLNTLWTGSNWYDIAGYSGKGFKAEFTAGDATVEAFIGSNNFGEFAITASGVAKTGAKFTYGIKDVGSIAAEASYTCTNNETEFGASFYSDKLTNGLTLWLDGVGAITIGDSVALSYAGGDLYVGYGTDDFSFFVYGQALYTTALAIKPDAKVTAKLGALNAYLEVWSTNVLANSLDLYVKPGIGGSIGECGWDVNVNTKIVPTFTVSVPVTFTVNF